MTNVQAVPITGKQPDQDRASPATLNPSDRARDEYSLIRAVLLHLAPGAVLTAFIIAAAPALDSRGIEPLFALWGGIGVVLVPVELGYLAMYSHRTTGAWSPLNAVSYTNPVPVPKVAAWALGLSMLFLAVLMVSVAVLDKWLADHAFGWMPYTLRQFATVEDNGDSVRGAALALLLLMAFVFNAVLGPVTEELYFRGHLLPRLERYGVWAPIINTALFGLYHFFSPWRYPAIILGFLPITWMAWRKRSIFVSMAAHVTINTVTVLFLAAAAASS